MANSGVNEEKKGRSDFWDSSYSLIYLVLAILFVRFYVLEPYKIPSGSMEPTLFGHEDYGDRIVTNKLAYVDHMKVWLVLGISAVLAVVGFVASKAWKRWFSFATIMLVLVSFSVIGGILFAWAGNALAGDPKRFDVVVFQYNSAWSTSERDPMRVQTGSDINYIKRLVGLPGDKITISGGDLFIREKGVDKIIRKWEQADTALQEKLWYPVTKSWSGKVHERPHPDDSNKAAIQKELEFIAFPWSGAEEGTAGVKREANAVQLDGSAPVTLKLPFDVTNVYLKQGRWPFIHSDCPAIKSSGIKSESGIVWRDPNAPTREITAYVWNTWEGVQCPNCRQIMYPPRLKSLDNKLPDSTLLQPDAPKFFYGGEFNVGDLKMDLELDVQSGGSITMQVGSQLHSAVWNIGEGQVTAKASDNVHPVEKKTSALSPGQHRLTLAYVDATVVALLDGEEIAKQLVDVRPWPRNLNKNNTNGLGNRLPGPSTIATISFAGFKGTVTRLDLYRDLYYTPYEQESLSTRQSLSPALRWVDEDGNYRAEIPEGQYMMLGDNSPSSADSRVWGFVPKDRLVGRASIVWWPPSRWRIIK